MYTKIVSVISALKHAISFTTLNTAIQIYQSPFSLILTIAARNSLGETLSTKLQELQNQAARFTMRSTLRWDNLSLRPQKFKLGLMFKTLKNNGFNLRNCQVRRN